MLSVGENRDWCALKALLTSWQVGILFELFKEEGISIRELKMMEYTHIHCLLKDYKMGEKIRFEHNFKSWRHKIGIPLKSIETNHHICCCCNRRYHENNVIETQHAADRTESNSPLNNDTKRKRLDSDLGAIIKDEQDQNHVSLSPQSVHSNNSLLNMLNSDDGFNFGTITAATNERATTNTDNEIDITNMPLQTLSELLSDFDNHSTPKFPSKNTTEKYTINLKQILKNSGSQGMTIVKFYKEKNRLTNVHRSSLIQIIVDYFVENDCHLSLNLSHNLEWEILKMFPTEKLEYYRTGKRGKIYAKFSNMKRYKRERSLKASTEVEALTPNSYSLRRKNKEYEMTNSEEGYDYGSCPIDEPEIVLKEENVNEDENGDGDE